MKRLLRPLALLAATTLVVAGCSGDGEAEPADPPASSSPTEPTDAAEAAYPPVPDDVLLTPPGTDLDFGEAATVAWDTGEVVGVVDLDVKQVREVTLREFRGWVTDATMQESRPYFVTVTVENVGESELGGVRVPLLLRDETGVLGPPWSFDGAFRPCPSKPLPQAFGPGERERACLVFLAPQGAKVDAMAFEPTVDFEAITWTGEVSTPRSRKAEQRQREKQRKQRERRRDRQPGVRR